MTEAQRIRKSYCRPAIYLSETEWNQTGRGKLPSCFHVERFVWVDQLLPEYRVAIPEDTTQWQDDEYWVRNASGLRTRFLTYLPTGRQVYDNTLPERSAIVFEYELEHYARKREVSK